MTVIHFAIRSFMKPNGKPFYKMLCGGASSDAPRTFDPAQVTCQRCKRSMTFVNIMSYRTAKLAGAPTEELEPLRAMLHERALSAIEYRRRLLESAEEIEKELRPQSQEESKT